jgi:hypothetical protein
MHLLNREKAQAWFYHQQLETKNQTAKNNYVPFFMLWQ